MDPVSFELTISGLLSAYGQINFKCTPIRHIRPALVGKLETFICTLEISSILTRLSNGSEDIIFEIIFR